MKNTIMDEENIPLWLNESFLTATLREEHPLKNVIILNFKIEPALKRGENYCSSLFRVNVTFRIDDGQPIQTSLVVKSPLPEGPSRNFIDSMGYFEKECKIYKNLFPIMDKMSEKEFHPKCYFNSKNEILVLEDLNLGGYNRTNKLVPLNADECRSVMRILGTFHGISFRIHKENPELIKSIGDEVMFCHKMNPLLESFLKDGYETLAWAVEQWEGFEHFGKWLRDFSDKWLVKTIETFNGKRAIQVLNHGDLWKTNILFKYNEVGEVEDVKLIDFQLCRYASPALDLLTFIHSSAKESVKLNNLEELYDIYITSFNSTLEAHGCEERLTRAMLQDELDFAVIVPFCYLPTYLPHILGEHEDSANVEECIQCYKENDDYKWKLFNGKLFKEVAKTALRDLEVRGFFPFSFDK